MNETRLDLPALGVRRPLLTLVLNLLIAIAGISAAAESASATHTTPATISTTRMWLAQRSKRMVSTVLGKPMTWLPALQVNSWSTGMA